jgi:DNA modification methylase
MLNRCETGDCREALRRMIAEGVKAQMCVTSPPYWGLRDYQTGTWEGGDGSECGHNVKHWDGPKQTQGAQSGHASKADRIDRHTCAKCGARRVDCQIGLEKLHDCAGAFTGNRCGECHMCVIVEVFRLVREVLADDGVLFLNYGDSYAHNGACGGSSPDGPRKPRETDREKQNLMNYRIPPGLKPKDLVGMPWRVALALQADGWTLRQDIIWAKPNPMPESVTDRCTKSHEYLFLLSKSPRYFFDSEAIREKAAYGFRPTSGSSMFDRVGNSSSAPERTTSTTSGGDGGNRNKRSVWFISSEAFSEAHFATFPRKLVEPCILAGTSYGHCPQCLARWVRVAERQFVAKGISRPDDKRGKGLDASNGWDGMPRGSTHSTTLGWRPTCQCGLEPAPDIVLDPFLGSGTVAEVAQYLGRSWIGIDLNPSYAPMQERRMAQMALALAS